jgi:hypothetical protein
LLSIEIVVIIQKILVSDEVPWIQGFLQY